MVKVAGGKTIHFHYDALDRLIAETNANGEPLREYLYVAGQRLAVVDYEQVSDELNAGVLHFVLNDHLGTPQLLLNQDQQVVWSAQGQRTPFGENLLASNNSSVHQPLRFPGQYEDETGYSYNYFRDYDPSLGRYIQSDPIGLDGGVNTFGYVLGNPIMIVDLLGLAPLHPSGKNGLPGGTLGPRAGPAPPTITEKVVNFGLKTAGKQIVKGTADLILPGAGKVVKTNPIVAGLTMAFMSQPLGGCDESGNCLDMMPYTPGSNNLDEMNYSPVTSLMEEALNPSKGDSYDSCP